MRKNSLREFDPDIVGALETQMWQTYYNRHLPRLFYLLVKLIHNQFHLNFFISLRAAYHSAIAARDFSKNRGSENVERIEKELQSFFKIISDHSLEQFNYRKVAKLEVEWWLVDRYPERYKTTRIDSLKNAVAEMYKIDASKFEEYARYRAEAMILHDNTKNLMVDWLEIQSLLIKAYSSLRIAL